MSATNGYRILDVFPDNMDFMAPGMGGEAPSIGVEGYNKLYKYYDKLKDKPLILKPLNFTDSTAMSHSVSARWCSVIFVAGLLSVAFIDSVDMGNTVGFVLFQVEPSGTVTYLEKK